MSANEAQSVRDLARTGQAVAQVVTAMVGSAARAIEGSAGQGARSGEVEGLSADQRRVLDSLAMGESVAATARRVGISRTTFYEWLKRDVSFQAAYNKWHEVMEEGCRARMATLMDKATRALERALDAGDATAAMKLLSGLGMVRRRGKKSTDPDVLRRKAAAKELVREEKLKREELRAKSYARGPTIPFSQLG